MGPFTIRLTDKGMERNAVKAEVFEAALSRVSSQSAVVSRRNSRDLKDYGQGRRERHPAIPGSEEV
jgi:hypothetical protein